MKKLRKKKKILWKYKNNRCFSQNIYYFFCINFQKRKNITKNQTKSKLVVQLAEISQKYEDKIPTVIEKTEIIWAIIMLEKKLLLIWVEAIIGKITKLPRRRIPTIGRKRAISKAVDKIRSKFICFTFTQAAKADISS